MTETAARPTSPPSLADAVRTSTRLGPELRAQAEQWQRDLPAVRRTLDREARALARPRLWVDTIGGLASTGWSLVGAAAPEAPLVLLTAAAAGVGLPVAPPSGARGGIEQARRLVRAGGPAYVKLGQFVASSQGLLPEEWVEAFAWCRDDAPPMRRGLARRIVRRELGEDTFATFDERPLAAGSIGQVHAARLADGTPVAVKVRRPGLAKRFRRDIQTLAIVAAAADRLAPAARAANLGGFVELFAQLSLQELDFRLEAVNAVECAAMFEQLGMDNIAVPLPVAGMVTERVLVMPLVGGIRYDEARDRFGAELDGRARVEDAIRSVLESTLVFGLFHGDLHAGNVLIERPDAFTLMDYGICARLDPGRRAALLRFVTAFATGDARGLVLAFRDFGAFDGSDDLAGITARLQDEADALQRRDDGALTFDRLGLTMGRLLRLLAANGFVMPKELVLFFKNLLYLGSFAAAVAPDTDLLEAIGAVLQDVVTRRPELLAALGPA